MKYLLIFALLFVQCNFPRYDHDEIKRLSKTEKWVIEHCNTGEKDTIIVMGDKLVHYSISGGYPIVKWKNEYGETEYKQNYCNIKKL